MAPLIVVEPNRKFPVQWKDTSYSKLYLMPAVVMRWNHGTSHISWKWTYLVFVTAKLLVSSLKFLTASWNALIRIDRNAENCDLFAGLWNTSQLFFWHSTSQFPPLIEVWPSNVSESDVAFGNNLNVPVKMRDKRLIKYFIIQHSVRRIKTTSDGNQANSVGVPSL